MRIEHILSLQRGIGNEAVSALLSVQRTLPPAHNLDCEHSGTTPQTAHFGEPGVQGEPPLPDDLQAFPNAMSHGVSSIAAVMAEFRTATDLVKRNTYEALTTGQIHVRYLEDCPVAPDSNRQVRLRGRNPAAYILRTNPENGQQLLAQRNAVGITAHAGTVAWIFVSRTATVDRVRTLLLHETAHALERHETPDASIDRYRDEFRSYWIGEYIDRAPDVRALQIRDHLLRDYPAFCAAYSRSRGVSGGFAAAVDSIEQPSGNDLNSVRWQRIQAALEHSPVDIPEVYAAINQMSSEERMRARGDHAFQALLHGHLHGPQVEAILSAMSR